MCLPYTTPLFKIFTLISDNQLPSDGLGGWLRLTKRLGGEIQTSPTKMLN